jgi:transcriptional regulator with XRE-family HTH domain
VTVEEQVGANIKLLRTSRKLTQGRLAELSDVERTYLSDVERGTRNVSLRTLAKIARALDCEFFELFTEVKLK